MDLICIVILLWEFHIGAKHLITGLSVERDLFFWTANGQEDTLLWKPRNKTIRSTRGDDFEFNASSGAYGRRSYSILKARDVPRKNGHLLHLPALLCWELQVQLKSSQHGIAQVLLLLYYLYSLFSLRTYVLNLPNLETKYQSIKGKVEGLARSLGAPFFFSRNCCCASKNSLVSYVPKIFFIHVNVPWSMGLERSTHPNNR